MKITEFISFLEESKEIHGDIEVALTHHLLTSGASALQEDDITLDSLYIGNGEPEMVVLIN